MVAAVVSCGVCKARTGACGARKVLTENRVIERHVPPAKPLLDELARNAGAASLRVVSPALNACCYRFHPASKETAFGAPNGEVLYVGKARKQSLSEISVTAAPPLRT